MELLEDITSQGVDAVVSKHHLKHWVSPDGRLHQFKYSSDTPLDTPTAQQARGIILFHSPTTSSSTSSSAQWKIAARPLDKFFNANEEHVATHVAPAVDYQGGVTAYEKADGTCMVMYLHPERREWEVATLGCGDASNTIMSSVVDRTSSSSSLHGWEMPDSVATFADLFWYTYDHVEGYPRLDQEEHGGKTFVFELMSPANRVVVVHPAPKLRLIAVRENTEEGGFVGLECFPQFTPVAPLWSCPPGKSKEEVLAELEGTFADMDPLTFEGYVVVDAHNARAKVKHPGYVALHHLDNRFDARNILTVVLAGESPEFLAYYPEYGDLFSDISSRIGSLSAQLESERDAVASASSRKVATRIKQTSVAPEILTRMVAEGLSARAALAKADVKAVLKMIGVRDVKAKKSNARKKKKKKENRQRRAEQEDAATPDDGALVASFFDARVVHGSPSSLDTDVAYVTRDPHALPSVKDQRAFVDAGGEEEDRNIVGVDGEGHVVYALKGEVDEVNNALLATIPLHGDNNDGAGAGLISSPVARNVLQKVLNVASAVLGLVAHHTDDASARKMCKSLLVCKDVYVRMRGLSQVPDKVDLGTLPPSPLKSIAMQVALVVALCTGQEIYTKEDAASTFPDIAPLLHRESPPPPSSLDALSSLLSVWAISIVDSPSLSWTRGSRKQKHKYFLDASTNDDSGVDAFIAWVSNAPSFHIRIKDWRVIFD